MTQIFVTQARTNMAFLAHYHTLSGVCLLDSVKKEQSISLRLNEINAHYASFLTIDDKAHINSQPPGGDLIRTGAPRLPDRSGRKSPVLAALCVLVSPDAVTRCHLRCSQSQPVPLAQVQKSVIFIIFVILFRRELEEHLVARRLQFDFGCWSLLGREALPVG